MLLKKRRPASHLTRKWILFSIGSTLRLGFFFFLHFKLISVNMEKAKFRLLQTFTTTKEMAKQKRCALGMLKLQIIEQESWRWCSPV
jgi:hypothetical protein